MKSKLLLVLAVMVLMFSGAAPSYSGSHVPGEVIVVFRTSSNGEVNSSAYVANAAASVGASVKQVYASLSEAGDGSFALLHCEAGNEQKLLEELRSRPDVLAVSLNHKRKFTASSYMPNDKYADYLWGMKAINANELWSNDIIGGSDVYAAVLDSGIDPNHEDLRGNISNYSRNSSGGSSLSDPNGHGTHIAGTIGADGNNGLGVAGVAWNVQIISISVAADDGSREEDAKVIAAINYIIELINQGVNVASVNMSFGSYDAETPEQKKASDPLYRAMLTLSNMDKTVMCVAAGNENQAVGLPVPCDSEPDDEGEYEYHKGDYVYPASFKGIQNMIVVSAANKNLERDTENSCSNYNADVAAPGELIVSSVPSGYKFEEGEEVEAGETKYALFSGTSMAAPHVAGAIALLKSQHPEAKASQIRKAILDGANRNYCMNDSGPIIYNDGLEHADADTSENGFLDVYTALRILPNIMATYNVDPVPEEDDSGGGCNVFGGLLIAGMIAPCIFFKRR